LLKQLTYVRSILSKNKSYITIVVNGEQLLNKAKALRLWVSHKGFNFAKMGSGNWSLEIRLHPSGSIAFEMMDLKVINTS
jgi:hypothetical protein